MVRKYSLAFLAGLALSLSSCSYRIADFTFLSSKNVDMNHAAGYATDVNNRKRSKDVSHIVICFPITDASYKEALDKVVEQNGATCVGIANAKVEWGWWYIPYIYGQEWVSVEGDPVYKK